MIVRVLNFSFQIDINIICAELVLGSFCGQVNPNSRQHFNQPWAGPGVAGGGVNTHSVDGAAGIAINTP